MSTDDAKITDASQVPETLDDALMREILSAYRDAHGGVGVSFDTHLIDLPLKEDGSRREIHGLKPTDDFEFVQKWKNITFSDCDFWTTSRNDVEFENCMFIGGCLTSRGRGAFRLRVAKSTQRRSSVNT